MRHSDLFLSSSYILISLVNVLFIVNLFLFWRNDNYCLLLYKLSLLFPLAFSKLPNDAKYWTCCFQACENALELRRSKLQRNAHYLKRQLTWQYELLHYMVKSFVVYLCLLSLSSALRENNSHSPSDQLNCHNVLRIWFSTL